jgi:hypothetical protein
MSAEGEGALGGAAQGAATGTAIAPGIGTLIGAGVGAIAGFFSGKGKARAAAEHLRKVREAQARIKQLASPEHLAEVMGKLQPLMRQIVASGLGPQFQQQVASSLAAHGATGTGVGEAMRSGAASAPNLMASQMGAEQAGGIVKNEMGAEAAAAGMEPGTADIAAGQENPLMAALTGALQGGAQGYISGKAGGKAAPSGSTLMDNRPGSTYQGPGYGPGANVDPTKSFNPTTPW